MDNAFSLITRGSILTLYSYLFSKCWLISLNDFAFSRLRSSFPDNDSLLRFVIRTGANYEKVNRVILMHSLSHSYRVFKHLAPDIAHYLEPSDWDSLRKSTISFHTPIGTYEIAPSLATLETQQTLVFNNVNTYGKSSLIVREKSATLPWIHFPLAEENICRSDPFLVALNSNCILTRRLPSPNSTLSNSSISLSMPDSGHFGHFVLEGLPRLRAKGLLTNPDKVSIKIDRDSKRFVSLVKEFLPDCNLIEVGPSESTQHGELLVSIPSRFIASDLTFGSPFDSQDNGMHLTDYEDWDLLNKNGGIQTNNLSLLRRGTGEANYRQLSNHEEISDIMRKNNFRFVDKDSIQYDSLKKEISNSRIIVTEAGASISFNLLFFDLRNTSVIFLQHPSLKHQETRLPGLLSSRGANVHIIEGVAEGEERQSNYSIDHKIIQYVLKQISE